MSQKGISGSGTRQEFRTGHVWSKVLTTSAAALHHAKKLKRLTLRSNNTVVERLEKQLMTELETIGDPRVVDGGRYFEEQEKFSSAYKRFKQK